MARSVSLLFPLSVCRVNTASSRHVELSWFQQTRTKPKSKSKSSSSRTFKRTDQITSSSTQSAGPSSHSQAQPTSLPNEIILQIFTCLSTDQASLLSCSRVSKTFHKLSSPLLWHHLRLSPFFAEPRLVSANGVYLYRKIEDPQKAHCGSIGTGKKDLKPLLKHVEKFYLESHTPEWCLHGYNTSLKLPNLQILELDMLSMLRDIPCLELEPVTAPIPLTLKDLERLTWIFHPPPTLDRGEKVMYKLDAPHRPDLYNAIQIIHLIMQLKNVQSVKLVNPGILATLIEENSGATEGQLHWESKDYILGKFGAEMRKMGWTEGKIGEWKDKIEFLTFEDWEEEQGWVGRFEDGEVEGWKEAMRG
ncbi:hypothetical protein L486_03301 [Kwoniella mangroviensis CBS 10435]|uniref:F-box domain-containing protein n=1 Tax=Kwoniella mangroviensis CBS 10435 TaxID=1331196 RepID=A0A1B9ITE9_9TREE|nr:hypothetical protein L486_03301 [Kwoniella mangroviensis CBS 10435]